MIYALWPAFISRDPRVFVSNLLFTTESYHLWFILLMLQLYLAHPFLSRWYRGCRRPGILVLTAFLIQIAWSVGCVLLAPAPGSLPQEGALRVVAYYAGVCFCGSVGYFVAGYYLLDKSDQILRAIKIRSLWILSAFLWIGISIGLTAYWHFSFVNGIPLYSLSDAFLPHSLVGPVMSLAALITLISFVDILKQSRNLASALLNSLGLYSYGVYLSHVLFIKTSSWILRHIAGLKMDQGMFYILLLLLTIGTALFSMRLLAKTSFGRYLT